MIFKTNLRQWECLPRKLPVCLRKEHLVNKKVKFIYSLAKAIADKCANVSKAQC